jgi:hypothetical protein
LTAIYYSTKHHELHQRTRSRNLPRQRAQPSSYAHQGAAADRICLSWQSGEAGSGPRDASAGIRGCRVVRASDSTGSHGEAAAEADAELLRREPQAARGAPTARATSAEGSGPGCFTFFSLNTATRGPVPPAGSGTAAPGRGQVPGRVMSGRSDQSSGSVGARAVSCLTGRARPP